MSTTLHVFFFFFNLFISFHFIFTLFYVQACTGYWLCSDCRVTPDADVIHQGVRFICVHMWVCMYVCTYVYIRT
jgi:hypothetical protein